MSLYYFNQDDTKDLDSLKSKYKSLSKEHHPDLGGDVEAMKTVNVEYDIVFEAIMKGKNLFGTSLEDAIKQDKELREKVDAISAIEGIIIEICGTWLWITGETREVKEQLKDLSFKWANKKKAWYFHVGEFKKRGKKDYSLSDIRSRHGSVSICGSRRRQIA